MICRAVTLPTNFYLWANSYWSQWLFCYEAGDSFGFSTVPLNDCFISKVFPISHFCCCSANEQNNVDLYKHMRFLIFLISVAKTCIFHYIYVNTLARDALAVCFTRPSATPMLAMHHQRILVLHGDPGRDSDLCTNMILSVKIWPGFNGTDMHLCYNCITITWLVFPLPQEAMSTGACYELPLNL